MKYDKKILFKFVLTMCLLAPFVAYSQGSVRLPQPGVPRPGMPPQVPIEEAGTPRQDDGAARPAAEPAQEEVAKETKAKDEKQMPTLSPTGEEMVYVNVSDQDIKDVVRQISKATGRNFIIDDKVKGKVTILSEKMMTKEEAYQAFLSALEMSGLTTVSGPGGIIKIIPRKDAVKSPIPTYVDSTPQTDSLVTRLISLQNISALEMSSVIKELVGGSMFAYPATNTLVITDSGSNIDRLMKIIKELDQEGPQQVLEIIPISYADAKDVAQTVLSLYEIDSKGSRAAATTAARGAKPQAASSQEDIKEVSKIIADDRTNSLIVLASKRAIQKVKDVIAKLDVPLGLDQSGNIHVHNLKYANAKELAETISSVTSGVKSASKQKGGSTAAAGKTSSSEESSSPVAMLGEDVKIGADEITNALIITASSKDYKILVDELISKLDVPRRQVYLESIVMELEVKKDSKAGVTGYGGKANNTLIGFGGSSFSGMNPAQFFTSGGLFSTPGLLGGLLARETITIDVPNSSGSGTQQLTIPAFAAFLNFLQTQAEANIVSTPNILTLDNQEASIDVSKTIYAKKVTQSGTTGFQAIEPTPLEAGLTLKITPQITEGDAVRLEIQHKLSNFTSVPNPETGAADTTKREIKTTVVAMDGQTVVLGGLMQDIDTSSKSKVPILGDIPILGWLFQYRSKQYNKTNLLIFITPYVIHDPNDFAEITKRKIEQRNDFIDTNFGRRQQRNIRDTIAKHRSDLLEYTPSVNLQPAPLPSAPQQPPILQSSARPVNVPPPVISSPPAITVSPVGSGDVGGRAYDESTGRPIPEKVPAKKSPGAGQAATPDLAY